MSRDNWTSWRIPCIFAFSFICAGEHFVPTIITLSKALIPKFYRNLIRLLNASIELNDRCSAVIRLYSVISQHTLFVLSLNRQNHRPRTYFWSLNGSRKYMIVVSGARLFSIRTHSYRQVFHSSFHWTGVNFEQVCLKRGCVGTIL